MVVGGLFAGAQGAGAQSAVLNLPRESQHAMVSQRIGVTDITINYHRPLVNGRKVFGPGSPQAYGQVWRAGANENTTIEFATDVIVEGKPLAKGVYGLHMIPGETDWTVIFSKNSTSWGSFTYDQAEDALRVTVKAHPAEMQEALAYNFDNVKANEADDYVALGKSCRAGSRVGGYERGGAGEFAQSTAGARRNMNGSRGTRPPHI